MENIQSTGTIIDPNDLHQFNFPQEIVDHMLTWEVIYKSPYSNSLYSSTDISWSHKPDQSFRVSDHWNFKSMDEIHCKTDKKVTNRATITLGQYHTKEGRYKVLINTPTYEWREKERIRKETSQWLKRPEIIRMKIEFKDRVLRGEIFAKVTDKGSDFFGKVHKYTGHEIKLVDGSNLIYNHNRLIERKDIKVVLIDSSGNPMDDIFKMPKDYFKIE